MSGPRCRSRTWTPTSGFGWLLPRSCTVLGAAPVLVETPPAAFSGGWQMGLQLDRQRRWDAGRRDDVAPGRMTVTAAEFDALTEEREELFAALDAAVDFAESALGRTFPDARQQLAAGLDAVRDW